MVISFDGTPGLPIEPTLASLEVTSTTNGVETYTPATGVDGYSSVKVVTKVGDVGDWFKITNRSASAGTITFAGSASLKPLILTTSTDGENWDMNAYASGYTIALPANGYVLFNGKQNDNWGVMIDQSLYSYNLSVNVPFDVSGDIMTLVKGDSAIFAQMFYGATNLVNASGLNLSQMSVPEQGYSNMFQSCTNLISAPTLPATTLGRFCYQSMFQNCPNLTTPPALPATTLADACYYMMFNWCTGLRTAPALPATTLADSCYKGMFTGCEGLTSAPALPATTLTNSCYEGMFQNCASLTSAPALPATTLAPGCYVQMFQGCRSITTAPALPATTLAVNCYAMMFTVCTGLTSAPALPATTLVTNCYQSMFQGCTSLVNGPVLPATEANDIWNYYSAMFAQCTGLTNTTMFLAYSTYVSGRGNMFTGVNTTGTLYVSPDAYEDYSTNESTLKSGGYLPANWTIAQYNNN